MPNLEVRHRRRVPDENEGLGWPIVVVVILLIAGLWQIREERARQESLDRAEGVSEAIGKMAKRRTLLLQQQTAIARDLQRAAQQRRQAQETGTGSSLNGKAIHRCALGDYSYLQAAPCDPPWVDLGAGPPRPRELGPGDPAAAKRRAEALLAVESTRNAAAVGSSTRGLAVAGNAASTCQAERRQRDHAYARVGYLRTFDFIRYLNDRVFEACKSQ